MRRRLGVTLADANTTGVIRHSGKLWNDSRKSSKSSISGDNLVTYKSRSVEAMLYDETDFLVNAW